MGEEQLTVVLESVRRALKGGSLIEGAPFNYAGQGQESTRARVFNLPMINVYILSIVGVVVVVVGIQTCKRDDKPLYIEPRKTKRLKDRVVHPCFLSRGIYRLPHFFLYLFTLSGCVCGWVVNCCYCPLLEWKMILRCCIASMHPAIISQVPELPMLIVYLPT